MGENLLAISSRHQVETAGIQLLSLAILDWVQYIYRDMAMPCPYQAGPNVRTAIYSTEKRYTGQYDLLNVCDIQVQ
ncbi:hypothetical protein H6F74_26975 [Trichocoleus sp. FACHB-90]|uniref:hypothetical protein n=1 Tax=Cyanophyceae TaxID=3028117 RepID=UPI00168722E4|nr:hypothetical protein [Trichocoleus sp. FACHB-90]MBD1929848.1 hypothetical protein [Trichocoleus sp. FACHB-90]